MNELGKYLQSWMSYLHYGPDLYFDDFNLTDALRFNETLCIPKLRHRLDENLLMKQYMGQQERMARMFLYEAHQLVCRSRNG